LQTVERKAGSFVSLSERTVSRAWRNQPGAELQILGVAFSEGIFWRKFCEDNLICTVLHSSDKSKRWET